MKARWAAVLLASILSAGCVLKAGGNNARDDAAPSAIDAGEIDAVVSDATPLDATPADIGCSGVDGDVVAYLTMNRPEDGTWPGLVGEHHAQAVPEAASFVEGPRPECGSAFDASNEAYLLIGDDEAFDLEVGSVDLWAQVPNLGGRHGIASRDANFTDFPGHFELEFVDTNQVLVRIQGVGEAFRCSQPQSAGAWIHIGVNFGSPGLELYINGVLADVEQVTANGETILCTAPFDGGIDGNDNPWVLGTSMKFSGEGSEIPVANPLGTAVDEFRVSRIRRDFTAP